MKTKYYCGEEYCYCDICGCNIVTDRYLGFYVTQETQIDICDQCYPTLGTTQLKHWQPYLRHISLPDSKESEIEWKYVEHNNDWDVFRNWFINEIKTCPLHFMMIIQFSVDSHLFVGCDEDKNFWKSEQYSPDSIVFYIPRVCKLLFSRDMISPFLQQILWKQCYQDWKNTSLPQPVLPLFDSPSTILFGGSVYIQQDNNNNSNNNNNNNNNNTTLVIRSQTIDFNSMVLPYFNNDGVLQVHSRMTH
jgi:hypothetical protein